MAYCNIYSYEFPNKIASYYNITNNFTRPEARNNCEKFGYKFCYNQSNLFQDIKQTIVVCRKKRC